MKAVIEARTCPTDGYVVGVADEVVKTGSDAGICSLGRVRCDGNLSQRAIRVNCMAVRWQQAYMANGNNDTQDGQGHAEGKQSHSGISMAATPRPHSRLGRPTLRT